MMIPAVWQDIFCGCAAILKARKEVPLSACSHSTTGQIPIIPFQSTSHPVHTNCSSAMLWNCVHRSDGAAAGKMGRDPECYCLHHLRDRGIADHSASYPLLLLPSASRFPYSYINGKVCSFACKIIIASVHVLLLLFCPQFC
jgi:hypothetical protein